MLAKGVFGLRIREGVPINPVRSQEARPVRTFL